MLHYRRSGREGVDLQSLCALISSPQTATCFSFQRSVQPLHLITRDDDMLLAREPERFFKSRMVRTVVQDETFLEVQQGEMDGLLAYC